MANYTQRSRVFRFIWSQKSGYFGNVKFLEDHFKIEGIVGFQKKFLEEWRDIESIIVKAMKSIPLKGSTQISMGFDMSNIIIFIIVKTIRRQ